LLKKKRDLEKIVIEELWCFSVYTYKWNIDCRNAHKAHLASWVYCFRFRFNDSPLSMQGSRCVYSSQGFKRKGFKRSTKKRSKLFLKECKLN